MDIGYVTRQLGEGDLSFIAGCKNDSSVNLTFANISLMESRLTQGDGSIKEKIAKGLYFYVAQPQTTEPIEELAEVDRGTMTVTVNGIAFAGKSRHVGINFDLVESISYSVNGITIAARNNSQRIYFEGADRVIVELKVRDRKYSQPLSGKLMRLMVEAVIKISLGRDKT